MGEIFLSYFLSREEEGTFQKKETLKRYVQILIIQIESQHCSGQKGPQEVPTPISCSRQEGSAIS